METREIQNELIRTGKEIGMCDKFMSRLEGKQMTKDELCGLFHAGLDFCIEHDWPSMEFIKETFTDLELQRNGIYTCGDNRSMKQKNVVAMGNATVDVYVGDYGVCDIYCRHNSHVNIHAGKHSFVYVSCLDKGTVNVVEKDLDARLCASYFSGTINNQELFHKIHNK